MTETISRNTSDGTHDDAPVAARLPSRRRHLIVPIMLQLVAMAGVAALLYPTAANWFAVRAQQSQISGYAQQVESIPSADRQRALDLATAYNAKLPAGVLRDPYTNPGLDKEAADTAAYKAYQDTLNVTDNGMIGELSYQSLGIDLPIFHGTSDDVLTKGAGHLFGSSLPVGGPSTHAVLTSHSGLLNAALFTPLHEAQVGDTFTVQVLGETHYYRVESTEVISPDETDHLRIVPGQDLVTLITCTPIGINSHRLLVHGVRADPPPQTDDAQAVKTSPGFAWWAVIFVVVSGLVAWLLFAPPRRKRTRLAQSGAAIASTEIQTSPPAGIASSAIEPGESHHDGNN